METVKLQPAVKDYIWGGNRLRAWGKESDLSRIAETWELSFHPDGACVIATGADKGKPLASVATRADWGKACDRFEFFPVLVKLIDAADNLSVQVHPSDDYALAREGQYGKTEMWYVAAAEAGAGLYCGFKRDVTRAEVEEAIKSGTVLELLNFFAVKPGESYFISSGTVHAIGKGVTIVEIQQNSNLTYRVYDYNRVGADGKPRPLHVDKALEVMDLKAYRQTAPSARTAGGSRLLADCTYFRTEERTVQYGEIAAKDSFVTLTFTEGEGTVAGIPFSRGDTFFIPAGRTAALSGKGKFLLTEVR